MVGCGCLRRRSDRLLDRCLQLGESILAGGNNSNPASPYYANQAEMYSRGQFKDVLFYKEDIEKHLERRYHPGQ